MNKKEKHSGILAQTGIYLGKFLRMFAYQNDWKVLPMGAAIAAVVTYVVGANLFVYQEGTLTGSFALVCVCIWNGFFNSIQVICRERSIVKREHRAGLSMRAYVGAHMIYQLLLCLAQTVITLVVCRFTGVHIPARGVVTPWGILDVGITILLITYCADMMALAVSSVARTTTTAMTAMPFLLMFQLIFSGNFFDLSGLADRLKVMTISHWGVRSLCAVGRYNELPMVTLWNTIFKFKDVEIEGQKPLLELIRMAQKENLRDDFLLWSGSYNQKADYAAAAENMLGCWGALLLMTAVFVIAALIALHFIDRDKR